MNPHYSIHVLDHGWLLCAPEFKQGIPLTAVSEVSELMPKTALIAMGLPHYYNQNKFCLHVSMAIAKSGASLRAWCAEIEKALDDMGYVSPEERWFRGTDVGSSSCSIFDALCEQGRWWKAALQSRGDTPRDADDFGRCKRLLDRIPAWRARLPEVAAKYPDTKWPAIIARWDELVAANTTEQCAILDAINK